MTRRLVLPVLALWILVGRAVAGEARVETDKVTYQPGETAHVTVSWPGPAAANTQLAVELRTGLQETKTLFTGPLAGGATSWAGEVDTASLYWGAEVVATVSAPGQPVVTGRAVFGVSSNPWELAIYSTHPGDMDRFDDIAVARKTAREFRAKGFTGFEAFFWAPCDMLDFTPDTERFNGGQGGYPATITSTKNIIAAYHEQGMHASVYANLWGGSGQPAMEVMRQHPEWFGNANVSTFVLDDYELFARGIGLKPPGLNWNFNTIALIQMEPLFDLHARELIASHKLFGWEAVRYDSYYTQPWCIRATRQVREKVAKTLPDFQFGYNSEAPQDAKRCALETMLNGQGLCMTEAIRLERKPGGIPQYLQRLLDWRDVIWDYRGQVGSIFDGGGNDVSVGAMSSVLLAAGSHPYYNALDTKIGQHPRFALRYAEFLWDNRLRPLLEPDRVIAFGAGTEPLEWRRLARTRTITGDHQRLVVHILNIPKDFAANAAKQEPAMLKDVPLRLTLPAEAKVTAAYALAAVPDLTQTPLTPQTANGTVTLTVPETRYWTVVVVDFQSPTLLATPISLKAKTDTFLQDWYLCEPFPSDENLGGHTTVFPPEQGPVDLTAVYKGSDGKEVRWKPYRKPGDPLMGGFAVDLRGQDIPLYNSTAYAYTKVVSDRDRDALLTVCEDDCVKVWLNGALVVEEAGMHDRALEVDKLKQPVKLKKGPNEILVKVTNRWMDWEFLLRLAESDGAPLTTGLQVHCTNVPGPEAIQSKAAQ